MNLRHVALLAVALSITYCNGDGGRPDGGGDATTDATTDASGDAAPEGGADAATDGSPGDADAAPPATYADIADAARWSSFDFFGTIDAGLQAGGSFLGGAFDGRYVYYVPWASGAPTSPNGKVTRFDTQGAFGAASSWSTFDMIQLDSKAKGYWGAIFDGRYMYFVPFAWDNFTPGSLVIRFDTTADFSSTSSWTKFDVTAVDSNAVGFAGGTFDGRWVYFSPFDSTTPNSVTVRYDTKASFTDAASWEAYDMKQSSTAAKSPNGAVFDGRYVYYVPNGSVSAATDLLRFDTTGSFTSAASWEKFGLYPTISVYDNKYGGGTFDGRYVYFVPEGTNSQAVFVRYDTTASFQAAGSYQSFDLTTKDPALRSFAGAIFDGRYVTCVPAPYGGSALVVRYDTTAPFDAASSYSTFDAGSYTDAGASEAWWGGAFDGEFVYFAPYGGSKMIRFDAKTPPSMPAAYHGSFY